jgi:uncharacterized protein YpmS
MILYFHNSLERKIQMKRNIYFIIIFVLFFVSCKVSRKASNIPFMKMNEKSSINLPFKVSKQELMNMISDYMPDTLFEQGESDDFSVDMRIENGEIIDLNLNDSIVLLTIAMDVNVSKTFLGITATSDGSMLLDISSVLDVDQHWHLVSNTTVESIKWIKKPEIKAGFIKFSVPSIVLDFLESKKDSWLEKLDSSLYDNKFLQKAIYGLDSLMQQPFPVDSAKSVGAKLNLRTVSLLPFKTLEDTISGGISVNFDTDIVPFNEDTITVDSTEDFKFSWSDDREKTQQIVFAISFTEDKLQNVIDAYMDSIPDGSRIFDLEDLRIRLDKVDVVFQNGLIGGKAYFSGDKSGDINILCRPFWDKNEKKILLLDRDVKIKMDDYKSKTLLLLFGKTAKKRIADVLESNLNELIYDSMYDINDSLSVMNKYNTVRIDKFDFPIQLEQDMLFIDIYLKVNGRIVWKGLNIDL